MIEARGLKLIYKDATSEVRAVDGVSLSIDEKEFIGICGPSGSGKSSLLYLLAGLRLPSEGTVRFDDREIHRLSIDERAEVRRKHFGFVFQNSFLIPYLTLLENVIVLAGHPSGAKKAEQLLESLHLQDLRNRFPYQVSAGERQRAAIARAVFHDPEIVFADEPTASLDRENAERVVSLLRSHTKKGSLVLVTHDETILKGADAVIRMFAGKLID